MEIKQCLNQRRRWMENCLHHTLRNLWTSCHILWIMQFLSYVSNYDEWIIYWYGRCCCCLHWWCYDTVAQKTVPMFACFVLNTPNVETIDISYLILSYLQIKSFLWSVLGHTYLLYIHHMTFIWMTDEHCSCFAIGW